MGYLNLSAESVEDLYIFPWSYQINLIVVKLVPTSLLNGYLSGVSASPDARVLTDSQGVICLHLTPFWKTIWFCLEGFEKSCAARVLGLHLAIQSTWSLKQRWANFFCNGLNCK